MSLDFYKVTTIFGDYDMAIITLDNLFSMLPCRPTPSEALSVLYR
jgi:hypothetical protein